MADDVDAVPPKRKRKSGAKTGKTSDGVTLVVSPLTGAVMQAGAHPKNTGGKKGRSGRPPRAFRDVLRSIGEDPKVATAMRKAAKDPESRAFAAVLKLVGEYDQGITLVSPEVQVIVRRLVEMIASRPTWESHELLTAIEPLFK